MTRLTAFRPELTANVEAVLGDGVSGLRGGGERAVADYLAAEQTRGRVPAPPTRRPTAGSSG
ncbi:hypothetical protein [Micromonospora sp. NPDC048843]|uniref:hypothetical protein n=1 Tax=Micromonospora sp. NPDC048843 TaxID=3155389 RepID=UPI0034044AB0